MVQITIEVPEDLAERLAVVQDRLPEVLARRLDQSSPFLNEVYRYILEFLTTNPSPQAVIDFKPTAAVVQGVLCAATIVAHPRCGGYFLFACCLTFTVP